MTKREARCCCGDLRAVCLGEPRLVSLCHCPACQRRTGGPFGIAAFFEEGQVTISGPSTDYARPSDSGHPVTFSFCPTCGGTVFWRPVRKPDWIAVAPGAFADPDFPAPTQAVYTEHRHAWLADLNIGEGGENPA